MEELEKNINCLENNIWITRKCRINAAERLQSNENFLRGISIYYSVVTTILALTNALVLHNNVVDVATLIFSVATTNVILYLDTKNFKDRYLAFKDNYISLNLLLTRIKERKSAGMQLQDYVDIAKEYNELLEKVENHKEKDLVKLIHDQSPQNISYQLTLRKKIKYCFQWGLIFLIKVSAILLPVIVFYIWKFINDLHG